MTLPTGTPGDEVPEADWAEQVTEVGSDGEPPEVWSAGPARSREADEADLAEQELPVDLSEDDR